MEGTGIALSLSLWSGLKFPHIIAKKTYFQTHFYGNTILKMRAWPTNIFSMPFLKNS